MKIEYFELNKDYVIIMSVYMCVKKILKYLSDSFGSLLFPQIKSAMLIQVRCKLIGFYGFYLLPYSGAIRFYAPS